MRALLTSRTKNQLFNSSPPHNMQLSLNFSSQYTTCLHGLQPGNNIGC